MQINQHSSCETYLECSPPGQEKRISEIGAGKRSITTETGLRLCRLFDLSKGYWLQAQAAHTIEVVKSKMAFLPAAKRFLKTLI